MQELSRKKKKERKARNFFIILKAQTVVIIIAIPSSFIFPWTRARIVPSLLLIAFHFLDFSAPRWLRRNFSLCKLSTRVQSVDCPQLRGGERETGQRDDLSKLKHTSFFELHNNDGGRRQA